MRAAGGVVCDFYRFIVSLLYGKYWKEKRCGALNHFDIFQIVSFLRWAGPSEISAHGTPKVQAHSSITAASFYASGFAKLKNHL